MVLEISFMEFNYDSNSFASFSSSVLLFTITGFPSTKMQPCISSPALGDTKSSLTSTPRTSATSVRRLNVGFPFKDWDKVMGFIPNFSAISAIVIPFDLAISRIFSAIIQSI